MIICLRGRRSGHPSGHAGAAPSARSWASGGGREQTGDRQSAAMVFADAKAERHHDLFSASTMAMAPALFGKRVSYDQ